MTSSAAPAPKPPSLGADFLKVLLFPLWLFVVPGFGLGFTLVGQPQLDQLIEESIERQIGQASNIPADKKAKMVDFYRAHPASAVCDDTSPRLAQFREDVCERWGDVWQFAQAKRVAEFALGLGLLSVVCAVLLGLIAFLNRRAQYWSFMFGWRALTFVCATETVLQGALAVWLSYWVTALWMHLYSIKLILVLAVVAGAAGYVALKGIFKRAPEPEPLDAELVAKADAPELWARLRKLAEKLGTEPPTHLVAGIDDNFFVTEAGLRIASEKLSGRALYVSLPLLRILEPSEASAVFTHELAHFQGGDTAAIAKLGPKLVRYDLYMAELANGGATRPAFFLMRLFRAIFELARKKEARKRELMADRAAAKLTSPEDVARSLLKVTAYSSFRATTERTLFEQQERHTEALGLKERIDRGLSQYVASAQFVDALKITRTPHPFDTHPLLEERLANVGAKVKVEDATDLLQSAPTGTWADSMQTAGSIEERLWSAYEVRFRASHERNLAYRYLPASDEERVHVERFFPPMAFPYSKGGEVRVTYEGVSTPGAEDAILRFRSVKLAKITNGFLATTLDINYVDNAGSARTASITLRHLGKGAEPFKAIFAAYWRRDQISQQFAAQSTTHQTPPNAAAAGSARPASRGHS